MLIHPVPDLEDLAGSLSKKTTLERLLKVTQTAVREAAKLPSPSIVCHDADTDSFAPPQRPAE